MKRMRIFVLFLLLLASLTHAATNRWLFVEYSRLESGRIVHAPEVKESPMRIQIPRSLPALESALRPKIYPYIGGQYAFGPDAKLFIMKSRFKKDDLGCVILGVERALGGVVGGCGGRYLVNVTNLPCMFPFNAYDHYVTNRQCSYRFLDLRSFSSDGSFVFRLDDTEHMLGASSAYSNVLSWTEVLGNVFGDYLIEYSDVSVIKNHGWLKESQVEWSRPPPSFVQTNTFKFEDVDITIEPQ